MVERRKLACLTGALCHYTQAYSTKQALYIKTELFNIEELSLCLFSLCLSSSNKYIKFYYFFDPQRLRSVIWPQGALELGGQLKCTEQELRANVKR